MRRTRVGIAIVWVSLAWALGCHNGGNGPNPGEVSKLRDDTAAKVLETHRSAVGGASARPLLAFVGVDNMSDNPLGSVVNSTESDIDTKFVNSGLFTMINAKQVHEAKLESGLARPSQLFIERHRRAYMNALGSLGYTPDFLMWGTFTSLSGQSGGFSPDVTHEFTLEVVSAQTGETIYKSRTEVTR